MFENIAVFGTGAIGSSTAADLTDAGYNVTIVDQWPAHVEAMKKDGLHIQMPDLDLKVKVKALHICELASEKPEFDLIILAVKSFDTRWMSELMFPYLSEDGVLIGLQNSMNEVEITCDIIGRERIVGACIELSGELFTPGFVQRNTPRTGTWFAVGELNGSITPRLEEIQKILSHVAKVDISKNILGTKWTKLIVNSMSMGPWGLIGLLNREVMKLPGMFDLAVDLGMETVAVGTALGLNVEPVFGLSADDFTGEEDKMLLNALKTMTGHTGPRARTAPIHDHLKDRKNEIEFINGLVSKKGKELGISTPFNDAISELAREINLGNLKMDPSNYDLIKQKLLEKGMSVDYLK
tara:strand:- start:364 stop:1422 length:1059 start_codon:yes stop_codon:yes gene_type:complete